jgi:uracil-DNA glycosylase family 4
MNLDTIAADVRVCVRCPLHEGRRNAVPGEGPGNARIMLIGEAPGREEDLQGRPFAGRAGKVLDDVLREAGLRRQDIFITSVVKCRPPRNRVPRKGEVATCVAAHLRRQIEVISPDIICLLGGVAVGALLGATPLSLVRGRPLRREHVFLPTYHPAAAGRNPRWRQAFTEDMLLLGRLLEQGIG